MGEQHPLEGRTIESVRDMTDEEMSEEYWEGNRKPPVIILDDGTKVFPSRDPEGNGAGSLFGRTPKGEGKRY